MAERKVEVTSSAWLTEPEQFHYVMGQINKKRPKDAQIGVELYPIAHRLPISEQTARKIPIRAIQENLYAFRDGRIDIDKIRNWQEEYGRTPIERIHLPFHYNIPTALKEFFWNSAVPFAKPYEPGDPKDRWLIAAPVALMTMTAMNGFATRLAGEISQELDMQAPSLNAHVYIIEQAEKRGKVESIQGDSSGILVENDLDYPRIRPDQVRVERDPARAISAVERNNLEGVIFGVDHAYRSQLDPRSDLVNFKEDFEKHLRTVHLSGSRGDHGLIWDNDVEFWDLVDFVSGHVRSDVVFCLDLSPKEMGRMNSDEQVEYMESLIAKLEKK